MVYTARNIVAICGSRDSPGMERIFNVLYPAPECQVMKDAFQVSCDAEFAPMMTEFGTSALRALA